MTPPMTFSAFGVQPACGPVATVCQRVYPRRIAGVVVLVTAALFATVAAAHSWYPFECCNDDDCAPVTASELSASGQSSIMTNRLGRILVPHTFPRRISPDNRTHLCVLHTPSGPVPRCLFVPGTS